MIACLCNRCLRRAGIWGGAVYIGHQRVVPHKTHHVDLATSTGELTTCGRQIHEVPGVVSPFIEEVDCRICIYEWSRRERWKIYPRED